MQNGPTSIAEKCCGNHNSSSSSPMRSTRLTLAEAAAISHFDSTATDKAIQHVGAALENLLSRYCAQQCQQGSSSMVVSSYDMAKVQRALQVEINWMALFRHYDDHQNRRTRCLTMSETKNGHNGRTTPLGLLIGILTENAIVWPPVCYEATFQVLWETVLLYCGQRHQKTPSSSSSRCKKEQENDNDDGDDEDFLSPSQRLVWNAMLRMCQSSIPLQKQIFHDDDGVHALPRIQNHQQHVYLRQCQVLFQMLQELLRQQLFWRRHRQPNNHFAIRLALRMLRLSEPCMLLQEDNNNDYAYFSFNSHAAAAAAGAACARRQRRRIQMNSYEITADNDDGFGDDVEDEDDHHGGLHRRCIPKQVGIQSPKVSLARMLAQQASTHKSAHITKGTQMNDELSERWTTWREDVLSFVLEKMGKNYNPNAMVDLIWSICLERPQESALVRFVLALILSSHPKIALEWTLSLLPPVDSSSCVAAPGSANFFFAEYNLQCYSEFVVELAIFDDLDLLQSVTAPLIKCLLDASESVHEETKSNDSIIINNNHVPHWLLKRTFVYILSRRWKVLNSIPYFASVKAEISLAWPSVSDWVDPSLSSEQQSQAITVLHQSGIVGVCEAIEFCSMKPSKTASSKTGALSDEEWPFDQWRGVRAVSHGCGRRHSSQPLFSFLTPGEGLGSSSSTPENLGDFVARHLHGDLLLRVFGYLGFKRMAHVGLVCKEWRNLADNQRLWQSYYKRRYGTIDEDPLSVDPNQPWKTHFHHRFIVEREIRSRTSVRGGRGRKLRVCKYVGCNEIFSSDLQIERHCARHVRNAEKEARKKLKESTKTEQKKRKSPTTKRIPKKRLNSCGAQESSTCAST